MSPSAAHRLLVVGQLEYGSTSWSRLKALRRMIPTVETVETKALICGLSFWRQLLTNHLYVGPNVRRINRVVLDRAAAFRPDLIWIDNGLHLWPATLAALRTLGSRLLVHYSPDNRQVRTNQSPQYLRTIPSYDLHVTTKRHNVAWLLERGARRVEYVGDAFDPEIHRPVTLTAEEQARFGCDVGFIGHWEPDREALLCWLWQRGYRLKVWGPDWQRARHRRHPAFAEARFLVADDYAKALCGAAIQLNLLSRWSHDTTTTRSVEIPACGVFMLAERTPEHLELFREGIEAEFFQRREELVRKLDQYLARPEARTAVAQAGRTRCLAHYTNEARLRGILERVLP